MAPHSTLDQAFYRFLDSGDQSDLAPVFDESSPALLRQARAAGLGADAAEDVVQETFVIVIERRDRFRRGAPFMPWAAGILVRQIRAEKRRRARALEFLGEPRRESMVEDDSQGVAAKEVRLVIERALATISESNREVVRLSLFEGLSAGEIGNRVSLSVGATAVRLHRGMKELREKVAPHSESLDVRESKMRGLGAVGGATLGSQAEGIGPPEGELLTRGSADSGAAAAGHLTRTGAKTGSWAYAALAGVVVTAGAALTWWPTAESGGSAPSGAGLLAHASESSNGQIEATAGAPGEAQRSGSETQPRSKEARTKQAPTNELEARSGTVVDENGRIAGEGVKIYLLDTDPGVVLPTKPMTPVGITDSRGSYALPGDAIGTGSPVKVVLARQSDAAGSIQTGWIRLQKGDGPADSNLKPLILRPGFSMALNLVDENGAPVEGAAVSAMTTHPRFFRPATKEQIKSGFIPVRPYRHLFGAESNDQGRASVEGLFGAREESTIGIFTAWKEGYAVGTLALRIGGVDRMEETLTLHSMRSLQCSGVVYGSGGDPIEGAEVSVRMRGEFTPPSNPIARTSSDGSWSLSREWLDEFPLELMIAKPGYSPAAVSFQGADQLTRTPIESTLHESHPFRATLRDSKGRPLAGIMVHAGVGSTTRRAITDAEGRFAWSDLEDGPIAVTARGMSESGRRVGARFVVEERGAEQRLALPDASAYASFSCTSDEADPLKRVSLISVEAPGFEGEWPLEGNLSGHFTSERVPTGEWVLVGETESGHHALQTIHVAEGRAEEPVRIAAPRGGGLTVVVADFDKLPRGALGGATTIRAERIPYVELPPWVRLGRRSPSDSMYREFAPHAPMTLEDMAPGKWGVVAHGNGWSAGPVTVEITADAKARVDMTAAKSTKVRWDFPPVGDAGWCTLELRQDEDSPWTVYGLNSISPDGFEWAETHLTPGRWHWKIRVQTFLDGETVVAQRPSSSGTLTVPGTGSVVLAPWGDD